MESYCFHHTADQSKAFVFETPTLNMTHYLYACANTAWKNIEIAAVMKSNWIPRGIHWVSNKLSKL